MEEDCDRQCQREGRPSSARPKTRARAPTSLWAGRRFKRREGDSGEDEGAVNTERTDINSPIAIETKEAIWSQRKMNPNKCVEN